MSRKYESIALLELRCWNYVVGTSLLELRCLNFVVEPSSKTFAKHSSAGHSCLHIRPSGIRLRHSCLHIRHSGIRLRHSCLHIRHSGIRLRHSCLHIRPSGIRLRHSCLHILRTTSLLPPFLHPILKPAPSSNCFCCLRGR
jgi:hypothetical protein